MAVKVDIRGFEEARRILEKISEKLSDLVEVLTKEVHDRAVEYAPVRTGFLRQNITYSVEGLTGRVVSEAPYSAFVEFGTRPHFIYPRRAKALRFEVGDRVIFARYVRHPSTSGQFYMRRALEDCLRRLGEIVSRLFG